MMQAYKYMITMETVVEMLCMFGNKHKTVTSVCKEFSHRFFQNILRYIFGYSFKVSVLSSRCDVFSLPALLIFYNA